MNFKIKKSSTLFFSILTLILITLIIIIFRRSNEFQIVKNEIDSVKNNYVGPNKCAQCHQEIFKSHIKTNHFKTTQFSDASKVLGSTQEGKNIYKLSQDHYLKVVSENGKLFEKLYKKNKLLRSSSIDLILGSGKRGQNFFTLSNDKYYRLPIHYLNKIKDWTLSPGAELEDGLKEKFSQLDSRCMSCHMTSYENFKKDQLDYQIKYSWENNSPLRIKDLVLGVSCESCHGPGTQHILFKQFFPNLKDENFILSYKKLSREQSIQTCAFCHSSLGQPNESDKVIGIRNYIVGDKVSNFVHIDEQQLMSAGPHANNVIPLKSSECFKKSSNMTCLTCHDVHLKEPPNLEKFTQKCLSCHQSVTHKNFSLEIAKNNCIDCHMPQMDWKMGFINKEKEKLKIKFRSHQIKIYNSN